MDHADVRERLELATTEAGGLERLMSAGDGAARDVRRHLSLCASCREEADALRLTADAIAWAGPDAMRAPAAARDRLLAAVAGDAARRRAAASAAADRTRQALATAPSGMRRWSANLGVLAGLAAAAAIAILVGAVFAGREIAAQRDVALEQAERFREVVVVTDEALRDPAHKTAMLAGRDGTQLGTVLVSPAHDEVAMVAHGLARPDDGRYRCFVERDGRRVQIGWMWLNEDLAYWAGPIEGVEDLGRPGDRILVTVEPDGSNAVASATF